ncbi:hypothetical protein AQUCO_03800161v1 [Aquilegia coerulea]|uniref:Uncharacterized protein n=1 Tax=Aquilegia coerulea TaxID=218851 RepID=A0A2G5CSV8_AQUCA|nr:hypothetical protein AQUCO_03800161v1 [Aquilegia coerulea]
MKKHQMTSTFLRNIFIETIDFFIETINFISSMSSDPLFSILITSYTLILLYFPCIFLNLLFSPILISTALLLSTLLRLGSNQTNPQQQQHKDQQEEQEELLIEASATIEALQWISTSELNVTETGYCSKTIFNESIIEWNRNVRAPLEVIHEEYEGEEHDEREDIKGNEGLGMDEIVSLSLYYPESDTGSSSSSDGDFPAMERWDSPENICFRWDQEEDDYKDGGLIEIPLDGKRCFDYHVEEENMIEIDIGAPVGM